MACKDSVEMKMGMVFMLLGFVSFLLGFSLLSGSGMEAIDERWGGFGLGDDRGGTYRRERETKTRLSVLSCREVGKKTKG